MADPTSAIVIRLSLPAGLERIRRRLDRSATLGVPAHVTILYPFLARDDLTRSVRSELAGIGREIRAFDVRFETAWRWPRVVYLEPRPREPFVALIDRIVASYPDYPPYAGTIDEVIPHLTIAESNAPLDDTLAAATAFLPFTARAAALEVLAEGDDGRWSRHWRLPLRP